MTTCPTELTPLSTNVRLPGTAAIAADDASEQALRRQAGRLSAIVAAQHQLATGDLGSEALMDRVAEMGQQLIGADAAVFEVIEGEDLVYRTGSGLALGYQGLRLPLHSSLSGAAIQQDRTLRCDDAETDPRVNAAACRMAQVRSILVCPMRTRDGPFGAVKLFARSPWRFDAADADSLELLVNTLGAEIHRKRAEEALRQREAMLEHSLAELNARNRELHDFAFVAFHDLSEPVRKLLVFADRLGSQGAERLDPAGSDSLQRMVAAGVHLRHMVEDLQAYASVLGDERRLQEVELAEVVQGVLQSLDQPIRDSAAVVRVPPLPKVPGQPVLLQRLFAVLLGNALKFAAPQRPPRIGLALAAVVHGGRSCWRIDVADNGIGFAAQHAERIFAPFQRLQAGGGAGGTGFGLTLARCIAERHGGALTGTGVVGSGAVFSVVLPQLPELPDPGWRVPGN